MTVTLTLEPRGTALKVHGKPKKMLIFYAEGIPVRQQRFKTSIPLKHEILVDSTFLEIAFLS